MLNKNIVILDVDADNFKPPAENFIAYPREVVYSSITRVEELENILKLIRIDKELELELLEVLSSDCFGDGRPQDTSHLIKEVLDCVKVETDDFIRIVNSLARRGLINIDLTDNTIIITEQGFNLCKVNKGE